MNRIISLLLSVSLLLCLYTAPLSRANSTTTTSSENSTSTATAAAADSNSTSTQSSDDLTTTNSSSSESNITTTTASNLSSSETTTASNETTTASANDTSNATATTAPPPTSSLPAEPTISITLMDPVFIDLGDGSTATSDPTSVFDFIRFRDAIAIAVNTTAARLRPGGLDKLNASHYEITFVFRLVTITSSNPPPTSLELTRRVYTLLTSDKDSNAYQDFLTNISPFLVAAFHIDLPTWALPVQITDSMGGGEGTSSPPPLSPGMSTLTPIPPPDFTVDASQQLQLDGEDSGTPMHYVVLGIIGGIILIGGVTWCIKIVSKRNDEAKNKGRKYGQYAA